MLVLVDVIGGRDEANAGNEAAAGAEAYELIEDEDEGRQSGPDG